MAGETHAGTRCALVVDAEELARGVIRAILESEGFGVIEAPDGQAALRSFHQERPDLVTLDVMMPKLDGWQTLERIRDMSDVPVIMISARDHELERARALRGGADDYLVKPVSSMELAARVAAVMRRAPRTSERPRIYEDSFLRIDFPAREVVVDGRGVSLTPIEFRMLSAFVNHPDEAFTRDRTLELVWGSSHAVFPDQVKLYVGYLRRKLGAFTRTVPPIETVRGFGYRYRSPTAANPRRA